MDTTAREETALLPASSSSSTSSEDDNEVNNEREEEGPAKNHHLLSSEVIRRTHVLLQPDFGHCADDSAAVGASIHSLRGSIALSTRGSLARTSFLKTGGVPTASLRVAAKSRSLCLPESTAGAVAAVSSVTAAGATESWHAAKAMVGTVTTTAVLNLVVATAGKLLVTYVLIVAWHCYYWLTAAVES